MAATASQPQLERRRSPHFLRDVALVVRGESTDHNPFREETFTISVSEHGALMLLGARVSQGQRLVLTNLATSGTIECRVARLGSPHGGLAQVGIEFALPAPWFWNGLRMPPQP
jgi:hypothetical protein